MMEWPLILMGGLLGSSHCLGMCGGFALSVGMGSPTFLANLRRQLVYSSGRLVTYAFLGSLAGFTGFHLVQKTLPWPNIQAGLSIFAGSLLVWQGMRATGLLPRRNVIGQADGGCLAGSFFKTFLTAPGLLNVFLAGLLTGFLPCGLVYAFLAMAFSTGDLFLGIAVMVLFGLGTVPMMVLAGCGTVLLNLTLRKHMFRLAAWCVLLTGVLTIARGAGVLDRPDPGIAPKCPMCKERESRTTAISPKSSPAADTDLPNSPKSP